jgi:hypothetical protein
MSVLTGTQNVIEEHVANGHGAADEGKDIDMKGVVEDDPTSAPVVVAEGTQPFSVQMFIQLTYSRTSCRF